MNTTTATLDTVVHHRDDGPATWFLNGLMTVKASNTDTGGAYCLMEHVLTPAGNPPMHVQTDEEEAFYVIDGEIEFEVEGQVVLARAGTFALVPRGAAHTFRVLTDTARATRDQLDRLSRGRPRWRAGTVLPVRRPASSGPHVADPDRARPDRLDGRRRRARHRHPSAWLNDDAERMPAMTERMLVVVAHPDDESFGCGSILAHAAASGVDTIVCCATRGEAGSPDPNGGRAGLAAVRERELRAAADLLDVGRVIVLDYEDSGIAGEVDDRALVAAPLDRVGGDDCRGHRRCPSRTGRDARRVRRPSRSRPHP